MSIDRTKIEQFKESDIEEEISEIVREEVNKIPSVVFPDVQKVEGTVEVSNLDEIKIDNKIDLSPLLKAIEKIKIEQSEFPQITDYTLMLDEIMKILERPNLELGKLVELVSKINNEDIKVSLNDVLEKFPELQFDKDGRLKVNVDKVGGGGGGGLYILKNIANNQINPATEDKQDTLIAKDFATSAKQDTLIAGAFSTGSGTNGTITLTNATTAYAVPASASNKSHTLIVHNGSDTDMYVGYATLTTGGILLPSGGVMNFDLGANQGIFAYCGSAGKILNWTYKQIN